MKIIRKVVSLLLIMVLSLSILNFANAEESIKVTVNGKLLTFDVAPVLIQNKTMVPLRAIFEALGCKITWDGTTQTVTGYKGQKKIILQIDNNIAKVDEKEVKLEVAGTLVDGRTMVPVRFIAESLGAKVDWEDSTNTVLITLISEQPEGILYQSEGDIDFSIRTSRLVDTYFIVAGLYYNFNHSEIMPYTSERELYRKAKDYFLPYKEHIAVKEFSKYNAETYAYSYLLNFSDLPEAVKIHESNPYNSNSDRMVELLKQFYNDSKAENFFKENEKIFNDLKIYVNNEAPKSQVEVLLKEAENYTGNKSRYFKKEVAYTTNITLFKMNAPFSRIEDPQKVTFATVAPAFRYSKGSDEFSMNSIIMIAIHESLHQYLNTPVAKNKQLIDKLTTNLKKEDYVHSSYVSKGMEWNRLIDENFVRAVEARIYDKVYGNNRGYKDIIEPQVKSGFKNLNKAYVKLEEFENNRSKYPTIDDFMPDLIEALLK